MKDCVLAIFWARKDILSFLRDHDCTTTDLRKVERFKDLALSRSAMVDVTFERLASRPDGGLGAFRSMLRSLVSWDRFDPYYFDKLKKLDRTAAVRCIAHLRQLQEIRDAQIQEGRKRRETEKARKQRPNRDVSQLLDEFLRLHAGQ